MLTTKEISEILKVSEESVRRWIRSSELKATLDGKSYLVKKDDLLEFMNEKMKTPGNSISNSIAISGVLNNKSKTGLVFDALAGSAGFLLGAMNRLKNKDLLGGTTESVEDLSAGLSIDIKDIDYSIEMLERMKKKTELEYQMKLLEIEDKIAEYKKLREKFQNEEL